MISVKKIIQISCFAVFSLALCMNKRDEKYQLTKQKEAFSIEQFFAAQRHVDGLSQKIVFGVLVFSVAGIKLASMYVDNQSNS